MKSVRVYYAVMIAAFAIPTAMIGIALYRGVQEAEVKAKESTSYVRLNPPGWNVECDGDDCTLSVRVPETNSRGGRCPGDLSGSTLRGYRNDDNILVVFSCNQKTYHAGWELTENDLWLPDGRLVELLRITRVRATPPGFLGSNIFIKEVDIE